MDLMNPIRDRGYALIDNLGRLIQTADLEYVFFNVPIWKHIYHTLYWFDYHFATPLGFIGADFHELNLESIDAQTTKSITKEQLIKYYISISVKSKKYLNELNDQMLYEQPEGYETNRLGIILGQFRHAYCHIGNINCTTIIRTGEWPLVASHKEDFEKGLYE